MTEVSRDTLALDQSCVVHDFGTEVSRDTLTLDLKCVVHVLGPKCL